MAIQWCRIAGVAFLGAAACGGRVHESDPACVVNHETSYMQMPEVRSLVRLKENPLFTEVFPAPPGKKIFYQFVYVGSDSNPNYRLELYHADASGTADVRYRSLPPPPSIIPDDGVWMGTLVWPKPLPSVAGPQAVTARLYTCGPDPSSQREDATIEGEGGVNKCRDYEAGTERDADFLEAPGIVEFVGEDEVRLTASSDALRVDLTAHDRVVIPGPDEGVCTVP